MKLDLRRVLTIARREYLAIVRRKAFLFTLLGTPAYFALMMWITIRPQVGERERALRELQVLAVVDSTGAFAQGGAQIETDWQVDPFARPGESARTTYRTQVRAFRSQEEALDSLKAGGLSQVLVIPRDYLETGNIRRYARSNNLFSSSERRPLARWLVRGMLSGRADSLRIERSASPLADETLFTLSKAGEWQLKDDRRELVEFLLPFTFGMLLGLCIVIGGQYLLQGVSEEKESRILESLLCSVSPEELLGGKLIGLGGAGLTLVAGWLALGTPFGGTALAVAGPQLSFGLLVIGLGYLLLGYLFYGSLMTGIGAMTNNMREAQQFAFMFTFANWIPFLLLRSIISRPDGGAAFALSMIPPTAPTAMLMRLVAPGSDVPPWQVALSMALLAITAALALVASARVFRVGLLMYGKPPNLPEIMRWVRKG
jgi:ABC-2 type transport system permease protein